MDGAWEDLGGGVYDDGRPPPTPMEPLAMRSGMPSCPFCGERHAVLELNTPQGRFECRDCSCVFNGTAEEWRRWRKRREQTIKRRNEGYEPLPVQEWKKLATGKPMAKRLEESNVVELHPKETE